MGGLAVHGVQVIGKDAVWGVDMLLSQQRLRIGYTTVALSYLHVLYLTREALRDTMERWPREQALVKRSYRTLCFMRGIVWAARGSSWLGRCPWRIQVSPMISCTSLAAETLICKSTARKCWSVRHRLESSRTPSWSCGRDWSPWSWSW